MITAFALKNKEMFTLYESFKACYTDMLRQPRYFRLFIVIETEETRYLWPMWFDKDYLKEEMVDDIFNLLKHVVKEEKGIDLCMS